MALAIVVAPMLVGPDRQPEITPADRDRELTDWIDEGLGGLHLLGTPLDGQAISLPTHLPDEEPSIDGAAPPPQGMIVRAHAAAGRLSPEGGYALTDHGDGLELRFTAPDDSVGLPVPEVLGEAPYVLDALHDAVSVADGEHAWLVTHDGDGGDPHGDCGEHGPLVTRGRAGRPGPC